MHKCPNCGQEFEGTFCPDCGEQWQDEKTCPNCGAKLDGSVRFCNHCGHSFVKTVVTQKNKTSFNDKLNSAINWIKSHLKIVIPIAIAVILVIILSCSIPACIASQTNGTYYKLNYNGEIDKETYFILTSGKWEDEDGVSGTYKIDDEKILFYIEFFGETMELCEGTLENFVLKINDDTYICEKHRHVYGEWETTLEPTTTINGVQTRYCVCGEKETQTIDATGTLGLKYSLSNDEKSYSVTGIGTATDTDIVIAKSYNGLPVTSIGKSAFDYRRELTSITIPDSVTSIGESAFQYCRELTRVTIPDSVTSIGRAAFANCDKLINVYISTNVTYIGSDAFINCGFSSVTLPDSVTYIGRHAFSYVYSVTFKGTMEQWKNIEKSSDWVSGTRNHRCTVCCTDGRLDKDGNELE